MLLPGPNPRETDRCFRSTYLLSQISFQRVYKKYFAEYLGTFTLVFAGTGAIVINQVSGGAITHPGIALTFGLVILAMIYTFGDISGAHFNPAVTIGFFAARRFPARDLAPYLGGQLAGAFTASLLLRLLFPENKLLGATLPAGSAIHRSSWKRS